MEYEAANLTAKNHCDLESLHDFLGIVLEIPGGYGNDLPSLEAALLARTEPMHFYIRSRNSWYWKIGRRNTKAMLAMFDRVVEQNPNFSYTLYDKDDEWSCERHPPEKSN